MAINSLQLPGSLPSSSMDFSPLANLGQIYQKAQSDAAKKEILAAAQLDGTPQSLSALATKLLPYDQQGAMTLSQLANTQANTLYSRGRDAVSDQWRQQESARAQQNADRSYGLQVKASNRADEGPVEQGQQRAEAALTLGLRPGTPEYTSYALTGRLPESNTTFQSQVEQRKAAANGLGLAPDNPGYQSFILTGKMPREDAQPLTAGDKEAIRTADDAVISNKAAIDSLNRAKSLSSKAFSGPTAGIRGYAASFLGESSDIGKAGIATENMTNEVMTNALGQMKSIFGGNPTEGERKILLEMQGAANKPDSVRQAIFDRGVAAAQNRLKANQDRADQLRGNTYYKPGQQQPATATAAVAPAAAPGAPKLGQLQDGYRYKGGDPADPASWVKASN